MADAVHNAGPGPRTFAATRPRVDVLLDVTAEHDLVLGREIAAVSRRLPESRAHAALNAFQPALTCSASPVM